METSKLLSAVNHIVRTWQSKEPSNTSITVPWFIGRVLNTLTKAASAQPGKLLVVGVSGLAGSGKDTGIELIKNIGNVFNDYSIAAPIGFSNSGDYRIVEDMVKHFAVDQIAFAQPLKQIAIAVGFSFEQCYNPKLKNEVDPFWGITPREFLQMCGTEMFRNVWREDVWTQICYKKILDMRSKSNSPGVIFVTDVRFPNEVETLKKAGGVVVRVKRNNHDEVMNHASENQIATLNVDSEFVNSAESAADWAVDFTYNLCLHLDPAAFD